MNEETEFELVQDGMPVARAVGSREFAWQEIQHYAAVYSQDGPVEIYEITRRRIEGEGGTIVTLYKQPDGRTQEIDIKNILPDDEAYFTRNRIGISMEEVGGMFVIYADIGRMDEDGGPIELIELSQGRSCEDTLSALRKLCEEELQ